MLEVSLTVGYGEPLRPARPDIGPYSVDQGVSSGAAGIILGLHTLGLSRSLLRSAPRLPVPGLVVELRRRHLRGREEVAEPGLSASSAQRIPRSERL